MHITKFISLQSLQNIFLSIVVRKKNLIVFEPPFALSSRDRASLTCVLGISSLSRYVYMRLREWVRVCECVRLIENV